MRIHIGGISETLKSDLSDLEQRFAKHGTIVNPLQLHSKPLLDTYFGFLTMEISKEQFAVLKSKYNNAKFKGSMLTVAPAKPDCRERWELDAQRPDPPLSKDQLKRLYSRPVHERGVILGRERVSKRDWRKASIRFSKKGSRKKVIVKCKKTKLWGYQKDKNLKDLVYEYLRGRWLNGSGDTIDVIDIGKNRGDIGNEDDEKNRNMRLLEEMFGGKDKEWKIDSWKLEGGEESKETVAFSESEGTEERSESEGNEGSKESEESEQRENPVSKNVIDGHTKNTTESLRQLFNTQDESSLSLFGNLDDDIVEEDESQPAEPIVSQKPTTSHIPRSSFALFFPHYESPFLSSQSQIAKLKISPFDSDKWKAEFYKQRGEWNREFKRNRRDVLRQLRKKNIAKGKFY